MIRPNMTHKFNHHRVKFMGEEGRQSKQTITTQTREGGRERGGERERERERELT